ncbi:MAG: zinc ribbon domain-containing protein [Microthrixaceae bacterium]
MPELDDLLAVQALDTEADQLRHRRDHLPELDEVAAADAALAAVDQRTAPLRTALHDLRQRQKALEDEAATVEEKAAEVDRKLYDGSVVAHKELEAFQADHRLLKDRQSQLEDSALELMEEAEPLAGELEVLDTERAAVEASRAAALERLAEARRGIDDELTRVAALRDAAAAGVPAEILGAYEPLRERLGGIGAARLTGARCEGCHLEIPSAELQAVRSRPADELVTCPECGRILVR